MPIVSMTGSYTIMFPIVIVITTIAAISVLGIERV